MKLPIAILAMIVSMPINPAIRPYEPKPERQVCSQQTYNALCVPRIKKASNDKVNWI